MNTRTERKSTHAVWAFVCNAALIACITVLLLELTLRAIGFSRAVLYEPDVTLGWLGRPGAAGIYRDEGYAVVRMSSAGVRDREHAADKPADAWRVAVLGDSYTEALQVAVDRRFTSGMERRLNACDAGRGRRVEVLNFGVSGYGTAQEYLLLRERVIRYSPDLVVLAFLPGNDIRDNVRTLDSNSGSRPYANLSETGEIVWDRAFADTPSFRFKSGVIYRTALRLSDHSRVVQAVFTVREILRRSRILDADPVAKEERADVAAEHGLSGGAYAPPATPEWRHAWNVAERLIEEMRRLSAENGAQFLLVTLSSGFQVRPDGMGRSPTKVSQGPAPLFYPDDRLNAFALRKGIKVVSLARPLAEYARLNNVFLHGFPAAAEGALINMNVLGSGHWNEAGHRAAAELISRHLCRGVQVASDTGRPGHVNAR